MVSAVTSSIDAAVGRPTRRRYYGRQTSAIDPTSRSTFSSHSPEACEELSHSPILYETHSACSRSSFGLLQFQLQSATPLRIAPWKIHLWWWNEVLAARCYYQRLQKRFSYCRGRKFIFYSVNVSGKYRLSYCSFRYSTVKIIYKIN